MFFRSLLLLITFSLLPGTVIPVDSAANASARHPDVSADGRFVVFESEADNLVNNDGNGQVDIFLFDRQTGETRLVSISPAGQQGNGRSHSPGISGNGRLIVFESEASNLVPGDDNALNDIFAFDRLTGLIQRVSVGRLGAQADGRSHSVGIDHAGRYIVYQSSATNLVFNDNNESEDVFIFDRVTENVIRASADAGEGAQPAISGDGRIVAFTSGGELLIYHRVLATTSNISVSDAVPSLSFSGRNVAFISNGTAWTYDRETSSLNPVTAAPDGAVSLKLSADADVLLIAGQEKLVIIQQGEAEVLYEGALGAAYALSADGRTAVFEAPTESGDRREIVVEEKGELVESFHIAGRVTDALGKPLGLVRINDNRGGTTRTDADGYFYLSGYPAGTLTLTPEKEGFAFEPQAWNLSVFRDVAGYRFEASPEEKLLEEARKDIGMPYNFNRGCENPYVGCGKPFHGFSAGFCTDLVLDAYTFGVDYDINYALQQDAYAHPDHFYRWRDARNTHDMWRYFHYSGQLLSHDEDYLAGDAVFFDWSGDGEIDHVALVSAVVNGRPVRMVDATGVTEQNPSGLAAELDWLSFHESTVRGHARWAGAYEPVRSGYPEGVQAMQTAVSGGGLFMRIVDDHGRAVSLGEMTIPGASYFDLEWEENVSVLNPDGRFAVEIRSVRGEPTPYIFTVQTLSGGLITGRSEIRGIAEPGEVVRIEWLVGESEDGVLFLKTDSGLRHARIKGKLRKP